MFKINSNNSNAKITATSVEPVIALNHIVIAIILAVIAIFKQCGSSNNNNNNNNGLVSISEGNI